MIKISPVMPVMHTLLCWTMARRMCTCLKKHFRMGLLKADGQVIHIITRKKKQDTTKILWGRIGYLFFSMHVFHISKKKSNSWGSRIKFSCTHFQSSPGWQAHWKSNCGFYNSVVLPILIGVLIIHSIFSCKARRPITKTAS